MFVPWHEWLSSYERRLGTGRIHGLEGRHDGECLQNQEVASGRGQYSQSRHSTRGNSRPLAVTSTSPAGEGLPCNRQVVRAEGRKGRSDAQSLRGGFGPRQPCERRMRRRGTISNPVRRVFITRRGSARGKISSSRGFSPLSAGRSGPALSGA